MKRFHAAAFLLLFCAVALAQPLERVHSIEGVAEYRLPNGLRVLVLPDPEVDTITVHITYLVGSRHEGYGEKGMAHLLEHMLFKGSKRYPNTKEEFNKRGARWNGTTSSDRTTYFQTFAATEDNLDWALDLEADRMVNAFINKEDLDSEMTVVRNEFEMGENNAGSVLFQRMQALAFTWHNYGNAVIGARSDIENVPIEALRAFYRTWYRPDNAVLIVAGRLEEKRAMELVGKRFGPIQRPKEPMPQLYTDEPTQDGERSVTLRRVGDNKLVSTMYRVPAGHHPDFPALDVLTQVFGDVPAGRLHRALVQNGLASFVWGAERGLHDPGYLYFGAALPPSTQLQPARDALLETLERVVKDPVREEEVERARTSLLNDFEKTQLDTGSFLRALSEFSAIGDWRLFFLYRERLKQVTVADVQRVAEHYLKSANRVVGEFVPTDAPDRAHIPASRDWQAALAKFESDGDGVALGEAFDPSPQNIESRVLRRTLSNGINVALLPKKTRGGRAVASLTLRWGDEKSLADREVACTFAGNMLIRGTKGRNRAQLKEAFEKLNAAVSVAGDGATIEVRGENLAPALRLVAEVLREPAFSPAEFEELKRGALTNAQAQRTDPSALAGVQLSRHLAPHPPGHPHYAPTVEERIKWIETAKLEDAVACYRELFGATGADFAAVGDFDPEAVAKLVEELLGPWRTPRPFVRIPARHFERPALEERIVTPDRANAVLRAGLGIRMRDDHPDFPALVLANYLLGGGSTARLPERIREKEGLSYSTYSSFHASAFDQVASLRIAAIFAPENLERVRVALREELERALREGFNALELETGKQALLEARRMSRAQDRALAHRLGSYLFMKRTFEWDVAFEKSIAALTPAQVHSAMKRHIEPARLAVVVAGDFQKK